MINSTLSFDVCLSRALKLNANTTSESAADCNKYRAHNAASSHRREGQVQTGPISPPAALPECLLQHDRTNSNWISSHLTSVSDPLANKMVEKENTVIALQQCNVTVSQCRTYVLMLELITNCTCAKVLNIPILLRIGASNVIDNHSA